MKEIALYVRFSNLTLATTELQSLHRYFGQGAIRGIMYVTSLAGNLRAVVHELYDIASKANSC